MKKRSTRSGSCHALGPCGLGWGTRNNEDSHTVSENKPQMFPINSPVSDKVSYMKPWTKTCLIRLWYMGDSLLSSLLIFLDFAPLQCCMCGKTGWTKHLGEPSSGSGWGCIRQMCFGRGACRGYNMWQLRETVFYFCWISMFLQSWNFCGAKLSLPLLFKATYNAFKIYILSVCAFSGIEPTTFALLTQNAIQPTVTLKTVGWFMNTQLSAHGSVFTKDVARFG